jgi:hypothetical protein
MASSGKRLCLGDPMVPKPEERPEAPDHMYIECADGYLRVMPPGDWIDFEGTVHYVQAGAPNVLTEDEARQLVPLIRKANAGIAKKLTDPTDQIADRLDAYAEGEGDRA